MIFSEHPDAKIWIRTSVRDLKSERLTSLPVTSLTFNTSVNSICLQALKQVANMDITLFMNPQDKMSEMPLKSFYRYVLEPEMVFRPDGSLTLGPSALFTDLPQKSLLTLGMQPPESWLVEAVRTQYDLDNILLEEVMA